MIGEWQVAKHKFLGIVIALILLAGMGLLACTPTYTHTEVVFGALLPLTGNLSSSGESAQVALDIAVEDINEYLADIGSERRVRLIIEDTKTDPAVALEKLQSLAQEGVGIVIGPDLSSEVEVVKTYANETGILIISHASTAPSLALAGDNVFRFVPDDTYQAQGVAKLMWEDGIRAIIPMWRGDVWGDGLFNATKDNFEELGGTVIDGIRYSPNTKDFSTELESLNLKLGQTIAQYGNAVAVHLMAFEEVVPIFLQAGEQNAIFSTVKWYGSDGTALDSELVNNPQAAQFAVTTGFPNPDYGPADETEKYRLIEKQIQERLGRTPEACAFTAYDALWVATQAYVMTGEADSTDALKKALRQTAGSYFGATGWTVLNEAGDRKFGNYDFWAVREDNGAFGWERVAKYQVTPAYPEGAITKLDFPSKPFRIITGWLGGSEQFVEAIAAEAEKTLEVPVVVVNKVGNEGLDAIQEFQAAPSDGYTLLNIVDHYAADFARGRIDVNPAEDWVPVLIGNLAISQIYIRSDDTRYSDWDELVAYAKDYPGLKIANVGSVHYLEGLSITSLERSFGVQFQQVFYDKSPERYASLIGGQTDILIEQPGDVKEFLESGKFKPILTLWNERVTGFENVPTASEKGADLVPLLRLRGLAVPKETPQKHIDYLKAALQAAFDSEGFQKYLEEHNLDLVPYPKDPVATMREQVEIHKQLQ